MIRLELLCCGRVLRLSLLPVWRWSCGTCSGAVIAEAGCLRLALWTRRVYWEGR